MRKRGVTLAYGIVPLVVAVFAISAVYGYNSTRNSQIRSEGNTANVEDIISKKEDAVILYYDDLCGTCQGVKEIMNNVSSELDITYFTLKENELTANEREFVVDNEVTKVPSILVSKNEEITVYDIDLTKNRISEVLKDFKTNPNTLHRFNNLITIDYQKASALKNGKNDYFLYVGREDCPDCQKFKPELESFISEHAYSGMYYLDIKEYRDLAKAENASTEDVDFFENIEKEYEIEWVPSVYHIRAGEILAKYEYLSADYYNLESDEEREEMEKQYLSDLESWYDKEIA